MRLLRKLPRQFFIVNYYAYPILVLIVVLLTYTILASDGFTLLDLMIILGLIGVLALAWWLLRPHQSTDLPTDPRAIPDHERTHPFTLLAFESEYCPVCMTLGRQQLSQLEEKQPDRLKVYRISVNQEPGKSLFRQFDGRTAPTYVLLDNDGKVLMDWPLVLPIDQILYTVRSP